jgi:GT2 family glycosyltransferase
MEALGLAPANSSIRSFIHLEAKIRSQVSGQRLVSELRFFCRWLAGATDEFPRDIFRELKHQSSMTHQLGAETQRLSAELLQRSHEVSLFAAQISSLQERIDEGTRANRDLAMKLDDTLQRLECLRADIVHKDHLTLRLSAEVENLRHSTSWRITAPLRYLSAIRNSARSRLRALAELFRTNGLHGFALLVARSPFFRLSRQRMLKMGETQTPQGRYTDWIIYNQKQSNRARVLREKSISESKKKPLISVVMATYNPNIEWLLEAIESVQKQSYETWELCIADDASIEHQHLKRVLDPIIKNDSRVKIVYRSSNGHISAAMNSAAELASGDWIVFLDHDDLMAKDALLRIAGVITSDVKVKLIYSDEDKLDSDVGRTLPFFKPDWSPHLITSQAYFGHLFALETTLFQEVGRFRRPELNGAQDYGLFLDCALRLTANQIHHIPEVLYHWRLHNNSTSLQADSKPYADLAGLEAVKNYIQRKYPDNRVQVKHGENLFTYSLSFSSDSNSLCSIIIPTRDRVDLLRNCVDSIFSIDGSVKFELIIVDNNSKESATLDYFDELLGLHSNVKVVRAPIDFNWSRLNNTGASHASGDVLVFLNNDTEVISRDWLDKLSGYAKLPDVGVAGGLLLYEDGSIQHSGVVVGMNGWADHVFKFMPAAHSGAGPFVSPTLTRNVLAVTGACFAVETRKFETLGQFDESFVICGSDVEFCIRAYKSGLYNVMCGEVRLYHLESKTRGNRVHKDDFHQSEHKYAPYRSERPDPFFNPNLSFQSNAPEVYLPQDAQTTV